MHAYTVHGHAVHLKVMHTHAVYVHPTHVNVTQAYSAHAHTEHVVCANTQSTLTFCLKLTTLKKSDVIEFLGQNCLFC